MAKDDIHIEIVNDKELTALFSELIPAVQHRIVINGFKEAAKEITPQIKQNLRDRTKIKKTSGTYGVKVQKLKKAIGVKIGMENYKLRWLQWGTAERVTKKTNRRTGRVQPTHFFYDAYKAKEEMANDRISSAIKESLQKTIKKYEKL